MENLGIDPKQLFAQIINFALFLYIFARYVSKPFLKFLDEEKKKDQEIKNAHEESQKQKAELQKKEQEIEHILRREREKVIEKARKESEIVKQQILDEAKEQAELTKKKAAKQITLERENIYKEAREKINELSFYLINRALKDILTEDIRKKITQQLLKNSNKGELNEN